MTIEKSSESSEHFDLTYSNEPASGYVLILELDDYQLKACWYHQSKKLITGFAEYKLQGESFQSALNSLLQSHSFLKAEFQQTIISFRNANYSLIPRSTDDLKNHDWFEISNEFNNESEVLLEHNLVNLGAKVLFAINSEI